MALLRVAERPRLTGELPEGAMLLELGGAEPRLAPLPARARTGRPRRRAVLRPLQWRAADGHELRSARPPGLDLRDPRAIRYRDPDDRYLAPDEGYVDYLTHVSHLRVARSPDGVPFEVEPAPTVQAATRMEEYGVEDPRITQIEGEFLITYVAVSRLGITTGLLRTPTSARSNGRARSCCPTRRTWCSSRNGSTGSTWPSPGRCPATFGRVLGIWLAESPDLVHWGRHRPVALPRPGQWDEARIGASLVPFRVEQGVARALPRCRPHEPLRDGRAAPGRRGPLEGARAHARPAPGARGRLRAPGFLHDVVFPSGHVALDDSRIRVYYGAADSFLAAADFSIGDILAQLRPC